MSVLKIIQSIQKKQYKNTYWLEGEETFFIDQITQYAEHNILSEEEKNFNLTILFGKDATYIDVLNACKRYPMFAEKQIVILKEAQQLKNIEKLEGYIANPNPSTLLFIAYRDKKLDARTTFSKAVKNNAELFTTKKLYDNQLPDYVQEMVASKGFSIEPKALHLLIDHVGNDLHRLNNETTKTIINITNRKTITADDIEQYVGISKEYNVFELQAAICDRNLAKAIQIIEYFKKNPDSNSIHVVLPNISAHFTKIYGLFSLPKLDTYSIRPHFYNRQDTTQYALNAIKNYGVEGIEKIIIIVQDYNLKSIGINNADNDGFKLLKEMMIKIML